MTINNCLEVNRDDIFPSQVCVMNTSELSLCQEQIVMTDRCQHGFVVRLESLLVLSWSVQV